MKKLSAVKCSVITAVSIALCVVLPMAFYAIPNAAAAYCPMHIPVLLCGLVCGGGYGLLCGVAGVLLSALITGAPSVALLPCVLAECACYGGLSGLLARLPRAGKSATALTVSFLAAMLVGRIAGGAVNALLFAPGLPALAAWVAAYLAASLPGLVIELVLLPALVYALAQARLIPAAILSADG